MSRPVLGGRLAHSPYTQSHEGSTIWRQLCNMLRSLRSTDDPLHTIHLANHTLQWLDWGVWQAPPTRPLLLCLCDVIYHKNSYWTGNSSHRVCRRAWTGVEAWDYIDTMFKWRSILLSFLHMLTSLCGPSSAVTSIVKLFIRINRFQLCLHKNFKELVNKLIFMWIISQLLDKPLIQLQNFKGIHNSPEVRGCRVWWNRDHSNLGRLLLFQKHILSKGIKLKSLVRAVLILKVVHECPLHRKQGA